MSYAEHGPRIFLAGRPNTGMPLTYGDYVLPRKRLEGRLKLHDSCSDIRAWSPNSLENSRYIRELSEHDSSIGKIIPVNVVVDNIIRLNSHRETELQTVKTELQKYKNLKLTPKQEEQLQNLDYNHKLKESEQSNHAMESVNISKSVPIVNSNSCLSIHLPTEKHYRNTDGLTIANQFFQLCPYALNDYVQFRSVPKALPTGDYIERMPSWVEYIDIALQTEQETRDIGVQFDGQVDRCLNKITTISAMSQTSFIYKSSEEDNSVIELDKISFQTNNREEETSECDASCSESTRDIGTLSESGSEIGTESDFDINNSTHKGIIIQKDSEIIVLKNELGVRDAELDEVHELNKNLEILLKEKQDCINTQQENLKILHDKLRKLEYDRNCEIEDLKSKLHGSKYLVSQLKQDLTKKCESCYVQSQEIENLKLCAKEVSVLKSEQDLLLKKLQKMNELAEKAENCDFALDQLKQVSQEKDKLKKQNHEQSCMLADQEEEIKRLLTLIRETTVTYQEQNLKTEIHEKTIKISQYEQELISLKREIGDFVNNLKHALNNLVEFNGLHEDICNCANCDLDITEEANNLLYNINFI
ncbi:PREDICTED: uncharacterized protein LOC107193234 [Dufourea novaeangliae]|uniref:uncharacterized protein LOC107193234 n=1 Tax=Dufourea novaeangliae TaxID=178035 RepID=UPI0007679F9E|nr:PREDICTED: uncharacterized protein LOC107193234 [Dufourea novaeangliae]